MAGLCLLPGLAWADFHGRVVRVADGDTVTVGDLTLEVIHCPGHTPGHVVFFHRPSRFAVVGDVLFQGSIGRTDFPMGNHQDLIDAAHAQKQFWLAAQTKFMEKGIDGLFSVLKIMLMLAFAGLAVKVGVALPFIGDK